MSSHEQDKVTVLTLHSNGSSNQQVNTSHVISWSNKSYREKQSRIMGFSGMGRILWKGSPEKVSLNSVRTKPSENPRRSVSEEVKAGG